MVKNIFIGLLLPCLTYIFFLFNVPDHAWFWTHWVAIGSLLLLVSSPNCGIASGLRCLSLIEWTGMMIVPIFFIVMAYPKHYGLGVSIVMGLSFLIAEIGVTVFWKNLWKRIKKRKSKEHKRTSTS